MRALLQGFTQLSLIGRQRLVNAYFGFANPASPVSSSLDTSPVWDWLDTSISCI